MSHPSPYRSCSRRLSRPVFSAFWCALLALALAACGEQEPQTRMLPGLAEQLPEAEGYNVLVVSFDALRTDHLPFHGYERDTAPRLTEFAGRSLVFDHFTSAAQATPTSFAAAWTGQLPFRVFRGWQLNDQQTLARLFSEHGYHTASFSNNIQVMAERGFGEGFDIYQVQETGTDDDLLKKASDWLAEGPETPFFGWVHFISPHTPYTRMAGSSQFYDSDYQGRYKDQVPGEFDIESDAELDHVLDLYDGEIYYADQLFGALMDRLKAAGLAERTIVLVTADHGEEFMDHGQVQHNEVWNEILQIPMIFHHPAMSSGIRSALPASNVDLYPTLAAWLGLDSNKVVDGVNLMAPVPEQRPRVSLAMTHRTDRQVAIEQRNMKLMVTCQPEFSERLYDRAEDPGETRDLILDQPARAGELFEGLGLLLGGDPCQVMQQAVAGKAVDSDLTPEQLERLKSLGYIQ